MKKNLRKKLISIRKKNYLEISPNFSYNIFEFLKKFKNIRIIGGYIPINYEFDCLNLLKFLETKKYYISLPVIKNRTQMNFYKYSFADPKSLTPKFQ